MKLYLTLILFFLFVISCSTAPSNKTLFDYFSKLKKTDGVEPVNLTLSKNSDSVKIGETYKFRDSILVKVIYSDQTEKTSVFNLKSYVGNFELENDNNFGYIYQAPDTPQETKIKTVYSETINYIDDNFIKQTKIVTLEKEFNLKVVSETPIVLQAYGKRPGDEVTLYPVTNLDIFTKEDYNLNNLPVYLENSDGTKTQISNYIWESWTPNIDIADNILKLSNFEKTDNSGIFLAYKTTQNETEFSSYIKVNLQW